MSEPIWCQIHVGVPESWKDTPLIAGLREGLINGMCDFSAEDNEWIISGEGNYGLSDSDVEPWINWMQEHHVPFIATEDAQYEFDGQHYVFDGWELHAGTSNNSGIVLTVDQWRSIVAGKSAWDSVEHYFSTLCVYSTRGMDRALVPAQFPADDED